MKITPVFLVKDYSAYEFFRNPKNAFLGNIISEKIHLIVLLLELVDG